MSQDTLRERLARAMALRAGHEWLTMPDAASAGERWEYGRDWWRGMAQTALHEIACDLADRKLRVVPEAATEEMGRAGTDGGQCANDEFVVSPWHYIGAWADMIEAAPSNTAALTGKDDQ